MTNGGPTILIVEDRKAEREALDTLLTRAGYSVVALADGHEALTYLQNSPPPSLILLDMLLPVLDGWHFLSEIKKTPSSAIPIIVTTGTVISRAWAASNGCRGFIKKPVESQTLFAEIDRCLSAAPP
jgi:CheY-like chemotaxis protein